MAFLARSLFIATCRWYTIFNIDPSLESGYSIFTVASHISNFKLWEKTKSIQCYYIMHFFAHQYNVMAMSSTVLIYMLHTEVISTLPSATLAQRGLQ